ncbi:hypothetical protein CSC82_34300 [Rhodobacteraceae bacterium 4F10]|nr:hypothetical protein CSC82_34300 [Rhodobacteraceae bacterium 4F10]
MNIKTKHVNSISNQMSLSLFDSDIYQDDPILFFGYKVDRMGEVISPQIVYIDEDNVKWIVSENDVNVVRNEINTKVSTNEAKVYIKEDMIIKVSNQ